MDKTRSLKEDECSQSANIHDLGSMDGMDEDRSHVWQLVKEWHRKASILVNNDGTGSSYDSNDKIATGVIALIADTPSTTTERQWRRRTFRSSTRRRDPLHLSPKNIRQLAREYGKEAVLEVVPLCLRGDALDWYEINSRTHNVISSWLINSPLSISATSFIALHPYVKLHHVS
jgi:hypothetical protein